jgi:hypothetical protein
MIAPAIALPHGLRAKMMFDPGLTSAVLRELIRAVSSWLRQRARRLGVVGALKTGAVTVIQRFNSALGASPHYAERRIMWSGDGRGSHPRRARMVSAA